MLEPNAVKVTMLFPMYAEDGSLFPFEIWDWWRDRILGVGAYHRVFSREAWEGQSAYWRGATVILWRDEQMADVESFLREAREFLGKFCSSKQPMFT